MISTNIYFHFFSLFATFLSNFLLLIFSQAAEWGNTYARDNHVHKNINQEKKLI